MVSSDNFTVEFASPNQTLPVRGRPSTKANRPLGTCAGGTDLLSSHSNKVGSAAFERIGTCLKGSCKQLRGIAQSCLRLFAPERKVLFPKMLAAKSSEI